MPLVSLRRVAVLARDYGASRVLQCLAAELHRLRWTVSEFLGFGHPIPDDGERPLYNVVVVGIDDEVHVMDLMPFIRHEVSHGARLVFVTGQPYIWHQLKRSDLRHKISLLTVVTVGEVAAAQAVLPRTIRVIQGNDLATLAVEIDWMLQGSAA